MRRARVAAVIAFVGVAAGCGASSDHRSSTSSNAPLTRQAYHARLGTILPRIGSTLVKQTIAISRAPDERLAALHIRRLSKQLREGAAALEAVRAPERAQAAQRQLVKGFRQLAGELPSLDKPSAGAPRPLASFASSISTTEGVKTIQDAVAELRRQGFAPQR